MYTYTHVYIDIHLHAHVDTYQGWISRTMRIWA